MESMGCEATCREEATRSARTSAGGASVLWRVLSCRRGLFRTRWHEAELRQCPTNLAGNLQMIDYLLNTPFAIPVAVVFAAGFLNRRQEVDKHGDPTLRLRGPFLVLFAIAMWFSSVALANLGNPSEKFSLYCWLAALCFLGSFYAFNKRITLNHGMIEEACTPVFRARYYLTTLESLEVEGNGQYLVVHFAHGRKITTTGFHSGLPYFMEKLLDELQRGGHHYKGIQHSNAPGDRQSTPCDDREIIAVSGHSQKL